MARSSNSNGKPAKGLKLKGTNGDDVLIGGAGNDKIYGRGGDDFIDGGAGNDYLDGGDGNNVIVSASGNNRVRAGDGNNQITLGDGHDDIRVDDGNNIINAGGGNNDVRADDGNNQITTGDGNDDIRVDDGNNVINAGGGNNRIHADDGNNIITTGDGRDHIHLDDGDNVINAGGGRNYIRVDDGNNQITTGDGDDDIRVDDGNNIIHAGGGNNRIHADDGNNIITTGDGNDHIHVDDGNNVINAGGGRNNIHADDGNNIITTGDGRDHIHLDDGDNVISSGGGDDDIRVDDGNNVIDAGDGNNRIHADDGNNVVTAGAGNDHIHLDDGDNIIDAGDGNNDVRVDDGNNQITTGSGNDDIRVGDGANVISSGAGNDRIWGGRGDDTIDAGAGNDKMYGNSGDDVLTGGAGNDWMSGGSGNDTLVYVAADNAGASDDYFGGWGFDTLALELTTDEWLQADVQTDIQEFLQFLDDNDGWWGSFTNWFQTFEFTAFDLDVRQFEDLRVTVDGIELTPEDDAVTANDDAVTTVAEDSIVTGSVLDNDTVPDLVASVELVAGPVLGNLTFNADGTFAYDPGNSFDSLGFGETATETFTYRVTDADGDSDTATVTITITGTNDAPVANVDTATATEDVPLTILAADLLANDTDVDANDTRAIESVGNPTNGTVALDVDGNVVFTPADDFSGIASFDYTIIDSQGARATATVSVAVTAVADAPTLTVQDSPVSAADQIPLNIAAALNDTDGSEVLSITIEGLPAGSQLNAGTANPDGSFTLGAGDLSGLLITPPANAPGEVTVQVTATSRELSNNDEASVTDSLTVTFNRPPEANDDAIDIFSDHAASADIDVLANDTDPDNDTLTVASVDAVSALGFNLVLTATGQVTYDAGATFIGLNVGDSVVDTFSYVIVDENGSTDTATATITIHGDNEAPVAETTAIAGNEDAPTTGTLQASDVDNVGLTFALVSGPAQGNLSILTDGSYTFDPVGAFESLGENDTADLSFTYSVSDGLDTVQQVATLTVQGENDAPVLTGGSTGLAFTEDDVPLAIAANAAISDVDGATLESATVSITGGFAAGQDVLAFTAPAGSGITGTYDALSGVLTLNGSASLADYQSTLASVSYENTSQAPTEGARQISIQVNDGASAQNLSNTVVTTIDVVGVNDEPTVDQGIADLTVAEESTLSFTIPTDAFADLDGDALTLTARLSDGSPLPAWITFDGQTFTGTPDDPEVGQLTIEVTADDNNGGVISTTFDLAVTEVNDIPVVTAPASATTNEDIQVSVAGVSIDDDRPETVNTVTVSAAAGKINVGNVSALSSATGLGTSEVVLVGTVANINATLAGLKFTPPLNASGNFDLTVVADDGGGQLNPPTVIPVNVTPVADSPFLTATNVTATFNNGVGTAALNIQTALRDLDGSEEIASVTMLGVPQGLVSFNAGTNNGGGTFTFTQAELNGLTMSIQPGTAELFKIIVESRAAEIATGATALTVASFNVTAIADQAITGTPGGDILSGGSGADTINGLGGNDFLDGRGGNDVLNGGTGNDSLSGGNGNDTLDGGAGTDTMIGGAGDDVITGGTAGFNFGASPDFNIASYQAAQAGLTITISAQGTVTSTAGGDAAGIGTDTLIGIDKVIGSNFNDVVTVDGLQSANAGQFFEFQGGGGDDLITVTGNNFVGLSYRGATAGIEANFGLGRVFSNERADSTLFADAASLDAALAGSATNLSGTGIDRINNLRHVEGSSFADILIGSDDGVFESFRGMAGNDFIDGGGSNGINRVDYANSTTGVVVNLSDTLRFGLQGGQAADGFGTFDTLVNINEVRGSRLNGDVLIGGNGNEIFQLFGGNDLVDGGGGIDWVEYRETGTGNVIANLSGVAAHGVAARSALDGAGGIDALIGIENLRSGTGNDILVGDAGANTLQAGSGNDVLEGRDGDDILNGETGNDTLDGGDGNDLLDGGDGNDVIFGGEGSDTAVAGAGDDVFNLGTDADGFDVVTFGINATGGILYTGGAVSGEGTVTGGGLGSNTLTGVDLIEGTMFDDVFVGGAGDEGFSVLGGNDQIDAGAGFDTLNFSIDNVNGGSGVTVTFSGDGAGTAIDQFGGTNTFTGIEQIVGTNLDDVITGAAGDQSVIITDGADSLDGGADTDTLVANSDTNPVSGVSINLGTGQVITGNGAIQTAVNFENVVGSDLNDTITGDNAQNVITGGGGNDNLNGFGGDDTLIAGAGNDTIEGGGGFDTAIFSGNIADFLVIENGDGSILVADLNASDGSEGTNILTGVEQIVFADGVFSPTPGLIIVGTPFADVLVGNFAGDTISGLDGNDILDGSGGSDTLFGGNGNDTLIGGLGNDFLDGGAGTDLMIGGAGDDVITGGTAGYDIGTTPDFNTASYQGAQAGLTVVISTQGSVTSTAGNDAAKIGTDTLIGIDKVIGSNFDDVVTVDGLQSGNFGQFFDFQGSGGNDLITVTGNDNVRLSYRDATAGIEANFGLGRVFSDERADSTLFGDAASLDAALAGSATNLSGSGIDSINNLRHVEGSSFADVFIGTDDGVFESFRGMAGNDFIDGGGTNGTNLVDYANSNTGVIVNLSDTVRFGLQGGQAADGFGTLDTLVNINEIRGSRLNGDIMAGSDRDESFRLVGGNDFIDAGAGNDWAEYREAGTGDVIANLGNGAAHGVIGRAAQDGAGGLDRLFNFENLRSGDGNDILVGDGRANILRSGDGTDLLEGGAGDDVLLGEGGGDTLDGGVGNDFLTGGSGDDTFLFRTGDGRDIISDFTAGQGTDDVLDLTAVANANSLAEVQALSTQVGADVVINFGGGDRVELHGVNLFDLHDDDFLF